MAIKTVDSSPKHVRGVRMNDAQKEWVEVNAARLQMSQTRFISAVFEWLYTIQDPDVLALLVNRVPDTFQAKVAERFVTQVKKQYGVR